MFMSADDMMISTSVLDNCRLTCMQTYSQEITCTMDVLSCRWCTSKFYCAGLLSNFRVYIEHMAATDDVYLVHLVFDVYTRQYSQHNEYARSGRAMRHVECLS